METPQETYLKAIQKVGENETFDGSIIDFRIKVCETYHQARLKLMAEEWTDEKIKEYSCFGEEGYSLGYEHGMKELRDILLKGE